MMPMIETMEREGSWLFRWRSYLPLLVVVLLPAALPGFHYPFGSHLYDQLWEVICLAVAFLGLGLRVLTVGYAPRRTSGRNTSKQVAETLNTEGAYSVVRNPLYLGNFFVGLGAALLLRTWWLSLIYALLFMLYYERIIFAEEMFLRKKFGQAFLDWAARTPAFLPRLDRWRKPSRRFNLRRVLRREHQTLLGIILVFFAIELICEWRMGQPPLRDLLWNVIGLAGLTFSLIIRLLRSLTNILRDPEAAPAGQAL